MTGLTRTRVASFEEEAPKLLEYLRRDLEFEPTVLDLRDLFRHLQDSVILYNHDFGKLIGDKYMIFNPAIEAIVRFLHYNYGVVKDVYDFARQNAFERDNLISKLKSEQAKRHHWE